MKRATGAGSIASPGWKRVEIAVLALLASAQLVTAQIPGVVDVATLPGSNLGQQLEACLQIFRTEQAGGSGNIAGGTCDASTIAGGTIQQLLQVNVDNVRITLGVGTITLVGTATARAGFRITGDNVTLEGQGHSTHLDATAFYAGSDFLAPIQVDGDSDPMKWTENVYIQDFRLTGGYDPFPVGVWARHATGLRIRRLVLDQTRPDPNSELQVDPAATGIVVSSARDLDLADNTIRDFYNSGIRINGSVEHARVRGNIIDSVGEAADDGNTGSGAIALSGAGAGIAPRFVRITDNSMTGNSAGVRATIVAGGQPRDYLVGSNTIAESRPDAIVEGEGIGSAGRQAQLIGNRITDGRVNGILLWSGFMENAAVIGNTISNVSQDGSPQQHQAINFNSDNTLGLSPKRTVVWGNLAFDDQAMQTMNYLLGFNMAFAAPVDTLGASNVGTGMGGRAVAPQFNSILIQSENIPASAACSAPP